MALNIVQYIEKGSDIIKTLWQNKRLFITASLTVLLYSVYLFDAIENKYTAYNVFIDYGFRLIAILFVISSFVCNINNKTKSAIVYAVASIIVMMSRLLICGEELLIGIMKTLPQIVLLVFLLLPKGNIRILLCLAWIGIFISDNIIRLYNIPLSYLPFAIINMIPSLLFFTIPTGLMYSFGFTAPDASTQQLIAKNRAATSAYLEEYKQRRTGEK